MTPREIADVLAPIAAAARRDGERGLLLPGPNRAEASVVDGLDLYPVQSLTEAVAATKPVDRLQRRRGWQRLPPARALHLADYATFSRRHARFHAKSR